MSRETVFGLIVGALLIGGVFLYEFLSRRGTPSELDEQRPPVIFDDIWDGELDSVVALDRPPPAASETLELAEDGTPVLDEGVEPAPAEPGEEEEGGARIAGRVVDVWGAGVPVARVMLWSDQRRRGRRPQRVDEEGAFVFSGLEPGDYNLLAYSDRHVASEAQKLLLVVDQQLDGIELLLREGLTLSGQVVEAGTALPVPGASIEARLSRGRNVAERRADSQENGNFTLSGLTDGNWRIQVSAEGFLPADAQVELSETEIAPNLKLELVRGTTLEGRVLDPDGEPVAGAGIYIMRGDDYVSQCASDQDGNYKADSVAQGSYSVFARSEDYTLLFSGDIELSQPGEQHYDISLRRQGNVEGVVLLAGEDIPINGATVFVEEKEGRVNRRQDTDESGQFSIGALYGGEYDARAWAQGYVRSEAVRFSVEAGGVAPNLTLRLQPGAVLEGTVYRLNGPEANAVVVLVPIAEEGEEGEEQRRRNSGSGDEGLYRLDGLREGAFEVFARSRDYSHLARVSVQLALGEQLRIDIHLEPAAELQGVVGWAETPPREVVARMVAPGTVRRRAEVQADGSFSLRGLYPGRYQVQAVGEDQQGPAREVLIEGGQEPGELRLEFQ